MYVGFLFIETKRTLLKFVVSHIHIVTDCTLKKVTFAKFCGNHKLWFHELLTSDICELPKSRREARRIVYQCGTLDHIDYHLESWGVHFAYLYVTTRALPGLGPSRLGLPLV